METYRLKSTLVENNKEYVIQTANDNAGGVVQSTVYVNGQATDTHTCPHPQEIPAEEVLSLVQLTHEEQKQEIETLLDAYRKTLRTRDPGMTYHLGTAFYYRRLYTEARQLFQAVVELDPKHHQSWNYLGMTHLMLNNVSEAVECCRRAVELRPAYADYHNALGEACLVGHDTGTAKSEFEQAVKINLYYADAYFNLGLALVQEALGMDGQNVPVDIPARAANCFEKASLIYTEYDAALLG
ncbi:MAG: tetratricopeptide repeat protein, partial [Candidatus Zixiibacteriota bacterium]